MAFEVRDAEEGISVVAGELEDRVGANGPVTPATETPGSWAADFAEAFKDEAGESTGAGAERERKSSAESPTAPATETPAAPPAPVAPDPRQIEAYANNRAQQLIAQREQAANQAAYNDWLNSLNAEEYGNHIRQVQYEQQQRASAVQEAASWFTQQGAVALVQQVQELGTLTPEEAARIDYTKPGLTYPVWAANVIEVVADRKASAKSAKLAESERERIRLQELDKIRKEYPRQPMMVGGGPSGNLLPFTQTSGMALLREAFRED